MSANDTQVGGEHYKAPIQHWDYVLANHIPYLEAQIIKYVTRWRLKNGLQDLQKARHFLDKLIEVESAQCAPPPVLNDLVSWPLGDTFQYGNHSGAGQTGQV